MFNEFSKLDIHDHSRNFAHFKYVYPVLSRRSGGISLGINLNTNNACNWRCIYCQVPNLIRGKPSIVDLVQLEHELDYMLNWIINSDFIQRATADSMQRFNDISISGNGEATLSEQFYATITIIQLLRNKYNITNQVKTILITNGSQFQNEQVQQAVKLMSQLNGIIWFKVDSVTVPGIQTINQVTLSIQSIKNNLSIASTLCPTYIQTCIFKNKNQLPSKIEITAYIDFIITIKHLIAGVLLYSTARPSALANGADITAVTQEFLLQIALPLQQASINVQCYE